jgi:hypothetical protein
MMREETDCNGNTYVNDHRNTVSETLDLSANVNRHSGSMLASVFH